MAKKSSFEIQDVFITRLKEVIPSHISLVDELAELLDISTDSAYRRLRNETALSIDETFKICKKYRISADGLFSSQVNAVTCNYIKLTDSENNIEKYLTSILENLKQVAKTENAKLIYAAEEVPVFRSFHTNNLATFKLFYWQRSVLNIAELQSQKFDVNCIPDNQLLLGQQIKKTYSECESIEIWTNDTIHTTIKQIEYYFESGIFKNKEDCIAVLIDLKSMVENMSLQAEHENKNEKNNSYIVPFTLYKSDLVVGTNCIHVSIDGLAYSYISFNTLNSLTTYNKEFCDEIEHWMKNLIKKSTLISGIAEKQRFQFFNTAYKAIDSSIEKIKNY